MRKIILCMTVLLLNKATMAQDNREAGLQFNHMALSVKDLNRSVEFYKNILQLQEITNRSGLDGIRWLSLGEGKELHLISIVKDPVTINKAVHIALMTPDFDAVIKRLADNKVVYSDFAGKPNTIQTKRDDGIKQAYFQDPDGYWIEINNVKNEPADEKAKLNAFLDSFNRAAARADYKTYFDYYADDAIFTGTDATERWDKKAFMAWAKPIFARGRAWDFTSIDRNIYFDKSGKLAWFDELLNTEMKLCRGSGVLVKEGNEWKIKQYILSTTVPNEKLDAVIMMKAPLEDPIINKLSGKK